MSTNTTPNPTAAKSAEKVARKKRVMTGARVVAEFPYLMRRLYRVTPEQLAEALERECEDFRDFIRDHRSRDDVRLDVERVYEDQCEACGTSWETMAEDGKTYCAGCGREVQP